MSETPKLSKTALMLVDAFKALDGCDPDTATEYSPSGDVFSPYAGGQYAVMTPRGADGKFLSRGDVIKTVESYDTQFRQIETELSACVALAKRIQNDLTHAEKVYRANAESYRAEISELRATQPT